MVLNGLGGLYVVTLSCVGVSIWASMNKQLQQIRSVIEVLRLKDLPGCTSLSGMALDGWAAVIYTESENTLPAGHVLYLGSQMGSL